MEDSNFISVIDYLGEINNGIVVLLSMRIKDNIYEIAYWFDRDDNYLISAGENFLRDFNIKDIYEYQDYKKLAYYIHNHILNNKEDIFKEFLD